VVEVDITRSSLDKFPIYAALGVPEVWRYTDGKVEIQHLREDTYVVSDTSRVLPGINASMLAHFIEEARTTTNQTAWFKNVVAAMAALRRSP
jgi:Uma2 family endonuclease